MNYVLSDIHGHYKEFKKMLKLINFSENDHLYICGDAIDKGPDSYRLILEIIKMVKNGRATYILGNHDHMMVDWLDFFYYKKPSKYRERCWIGYNGGHETMKQFEGHTKNLKKVYNFLKDCPLQLSNVKVGENLFTFVHSQPIESEVDILEWKNLNYNTVIDSIWERYVYIPDTDNQITLAGHTINYGNDFRISKHFDGKYYDLDCGCACNQRLGCLRLEDFEEFYIDCENRKPIEL